MSTATWPPPTRGAHYGMVEFRAMASPCRIVADTDELARAGEALAHELEARWSRYLPTSEISDLNRSTGAFCTVSADTLLLIERAEFARAATAGRFNPFVLDRLEELERGDAPDAAPSPIPDDAVLVVPGSSVVRLPAGCRFDPGGIGKGLAGDLIAERLVALGSTTVQVELGGDVRLIGPPWSGDRWFVDVRDSRDRSTVVRRLTVAQGAIATSSVFARTWSVGGREVHHIIDPATGAPTVTDLGSVTATSSELWWAEIVAKVALMSGSIDAPRVMRDLGAAGLTIDRSGVVTPVIGSRKEALR